MSNAQRFSASPDVTNNAYATYRGVFLNRSQCWHCGQSLGPKYTSVESRTGFPLFVHFQCFKDAEAVAWPRSYA